MSALILRHNWTRQPQFPVGIDESHPLADAVGAFYLPGLRYDAVVRGTPGDTSQSSPSVATIRDGKAGAFNVSAVGTQALVGGWHQHLTKDAGTMCVAFVNAALATGGAYWMSARSADLNARYYILSGDAAVNGRVQFGWASTATAISPNPGVIPVMSGPMTVALMTWTAANEMRGYVGGSLYGASTLTQPSNPATSAIAAASNATTSSQYCGRGYVPLAFVLSRGLSDSEACRLSRNPWQLLRPVQRRMWVGVETTAGTTDSLTPSDLVVGSPVLGSPSLAQVHALVSSALTVSSPVLGTPTLAENIGNTDGLFAANLVVGSPVLGSPALTQIHALTAMGFSVSPPVLGSPALSDGTEQPKIAKGGGGVSESTKSRKKKVRKEPTVIDAPRESERERIESIAKVFDAPVVEKHPAQTAEVSPSIPALEPIPLSPDAQIITQPSAVIEPLLIRGIQDLIDPVVQQVGERAKAEAQRMAAQQQIEMMRIRDEDEAETLIMIFASV